MAYRIAAADGNWTDAATWGAVDATSLLDSQAANTALTTSFVASSTFTPGAITIDGIAVKVASRAATPTGTMSVRLSQGGVAVAGTTVTIDVADLPNNLATPGNAYNTCFIGWVFFKFAAPVTLLAATAYAVQASTTSTFQVNLYRNATASNWARMLRTTTTAAPGAGDAMFVLGEWTAAGTKTTRTVTINETATTDYGTGDTTLASLGVSDGGQLQVATAAATQYRLRMSGVVQFWQRLDGLSPFTAGTAGTPIPTGSSFELQFDCAADNDFGIVAHAVNGEAAGSPRTTGKAIVATRLTATAAAAATSISVADDTGWLSGDEIAIGPTQRVYTEGESRVLNGAAGASSIAVTAGLTNNHDGDAAARQQADVILLTRNVRFVNVTAAAKAYFILRGGGTWSFQWVEFNGIGSSLRRGFECTDGITATFRFCAFRECEGAFVYVPTTPTVSSVLLEDCVSFNVATYVVDASSSVQMALTFTRGAYIGNSTNTFAATIGHQDSVLTVTDGGYSGFNGTTVFRADAGTLIVSGCRFTSNAMSAGCLLPNTTASFFSCRDSIFWRNGGLAIGLSLRAQAIVEDCDFWGNTGRHIDLQGAGDQIDINNCRFNGQTSYVTTDGLRFATMGHARLDGCSFGVASGDLIAHSAGDINTQSQNGRLTFVNCVLATSPAFLGSPTPGTRFQFQSADGVVGAHSVVHYPYGVVSRETSVVRSSPASQRLTPGTLAYRLRSGPKQFAVRSGFRLTIAVYVRVDGTYNGAAPRLRLRSNSSIGILRLTTLDTHPLTANTWVELTGQTPVATADGVVEAFVDVTGTAGNAYVDDWSAQST